MGAAVQQKPPPHPQTKKRFRRNTPPTPTLPRKAGEGAEETSVSDGLKSSLKTKQAV
ncbi:hypothetical protein HMPREF9120_02483 [Neisseria sp. oral taxon 020 str. F0370]|nr:hypothetical protein HMPREF9120_02483 [Neisseria sp. oral taxon 020 str. F0370]